MSTAGVVGRKINGNLNSQEFSARDNHKHVFTAILVRERNDIYDKRMDVSELIKKRDYFKALELNESIIASKEVKLQDVYTNTEIVNRIIDSFSSFLNGGETRNERALIYGMEFFAERIRRNEKLATSLLNNQGYDELSPMPFIISKRENSNDNRLDIAKAIARSKSSQDMG